MFALNYAGIVFNKVHLPTVTGMLFDLNYLRNMPVHLFRGSDAKVCSSLVAKNLCSKEISKLVSLFVNNDIPHRLFNVPDIKERTTDSVYGTDNKLVIHHRPRDMLYQLAYPEEVWQPHWLGGEPIAGIIVVGPHIEARKVYRWLDFWFRDHGVIDEEVYKQLKERMRLCKVYFLSNENDWHVVTAEGEGPLYNTDNLECETMIAQVNGLASYHVKF